VLSGTVLGVPRLKVYSLVAEHNAYGASDSPECLGECCVVVYRDAATGFDCHPAARVLVVSLGALFFKDALILHDFVVNQVTGGIAHLWKYLV
jgi:hypothetical protein